MRASRSTSRAALQHAEYELPLRSLGVTIVGVAAAPELPDAVLVEDAAVVLDEIAVLTRAGAPSRRAEGLHVAPVLAAYRPVLRMTDPATLDGGDVLCVDDRGADPANALRIADTILYPAGFPRTRDRLLARGLRVETTDASELAKAEGALTCCSLLFEAALPA